MQGGSARHQPWGLGGVTGRVAGEFGKCLGVFLLLWLLALMGGETVRSARAPRSGVSLDQPSLTSTAGENGL
jgi:hypothetical protein